MNQALNEYLRKRANELGMTFSDIGERAKISRQTLYTFAENASFPSLSTITRIAEALHVHPMRLLQLVFDNVPAPGAKTRRSKRGDASVFARDVTFADGALVQPNETFVKTWEFHNVGKVDWENRFFQCMDEEIVVYSRLGEVLNIAQNLVPDSNRFPVPYTPAGESVQISVKFTAPKTDGVVLSYWKTVFEDGTLCFPASRGAWVKVRVFSMANNDLGV